MVAEVFNNLIYLIVGNDFLSTPFVSDYSWLDNSNTKEKAELKEVKEKYPNGCKYIGQKKNNQR